MRTFLPIIAVFAAAIVSAEPALGQETDRSTKVANQLVELINAGKYAGIQAKFSKEMDAALPLDKSSAFFKGLTQQMGKIEKLKLGSIVVKAGDKVKRGQLLGRCGNSGNSSEPHLHYHLQNSPVLQDGLGIQCAFQKGVVTVDGKTETRTNLSPVKGQIISP